MKTKSITGFGEVAGLVKHDEGSALEPKRIPSEGRAQAILDTGEALAVGDAAILPSRIRIDKPSTQQSSDTVDFWDLWAKKKIKSGIDDAVESLRKQQS